MSAVIRGIGWVFGPESTCQSFSASVRFHRSARSRKMPLQDEHCATATSPTLRTFMADWHLGQVISSIRPTLLAGPEARPCNADPVLALSTRTDVSGGGSP